MVLGFRCSDLFKKKKIYICSAFSLFPVTEGLRASSSGTFAPLNPLIVLYFHSKKRKCAIFILTGFWVGEDGRM